MKKKKQKQLSIPKYNEINAESEKYNDPKNWAINIKNGIQIKS